MYNSSFLALPTDNCQHPIAHGEGSHLRISAWISARYALSQWAMAKPGTQPAQKEYLDDHPDFG
jgi:hypothetical protein